MPCSGLRGLETPAPRGLQKTKFGTRPDSITYPQAFFRGPEWLFGNRAHKLVPTPTATYIDHTRFVHSKLPHRCTC